MQNAKMDELQAGIKIARKNINNLRYANNATLMAENKEELLDHRKSKRVPEKTSTSALLTTPKPVTVWTTTNSGQFFQRWEYQTT